MTDDEKEKVVFGSWNYRIVRCRDSFGNIYFALMEVYYDGDGKPINRTEEPTDFVSDEEEGAQAITDALEMALNDARKRPVLIDEEHFQDTYTTPAIGKDH